MQQFCRSLDIQPSILQVLYKAHSRSFITFAVLHRASRDAEKFRIAEPKSQETCHAVSTNCTQRSFTLPHRRGFFPKAPNRKEKWSQKTYQFHRNLKKGFKNEDKIRFGRSPLHEIVFHISLQKSYQTGPKCFFFFSTHFIKSL